MIFDLADDFTQALEAMPCDHPRYRLLTSLADAIGRDIQFIARHRDDYPQSLFQCAWNVGWWYDSPQAAEHYEEPDEPSNEPPPWAVDGPKLHQVLDRWRGHRAATFPMCGWVRSLRPPSEPLDGALRMTLPHENRVHSVDISRDGRWIVSASDGRLHVWDTSGRFLAQSWKPDAGGVSSVEFHPLDNRILTASSNGVLCVWDFGIDEPATVLRVAEGVFRATFSSDGRRVLGVADSIYVWDAATGQTLLKVPAETFPCEEIHSGCFSPDGTRIAVAAVSGVYLLDAASGTLLWEQHHGDKVYDVAFSPDGASIVSVSRDETVRHWNARNGEAVRVVGSHGNRVYGVAFSPDGRTVATASTDYTVGVFDLVDPQRNVLLRGHSSPVRQVVFSADGRRIVSASADGTVRVWEPTRIRRQRVLRGGHRHGLRTLVFSRDGGRLFSHSASDPGPFTGNKSPEQIHYWDPTSGLPILAEDQDVLVTEILGRLLKHHLEPDGGGDGSAATLNQSQLREIEQMRRTTGYWTAFAARDEVWFIDCVAQNVAAVFPGRLDVARAQHEAPVWAGAESVDESTPYGWFDDWRARYLNLLRLEGVAVEAAYPAGASKTAGEQSRRFWIDVEEAIREAASLLKAGEFDGASKAASKFPAVDDTLAKIKEVFLEGIARAEMDWFAPEFDEAVKKCKQWLENADCRSARHCVENLPGRLEHTAAVKQQMGDQISAAESELRRVSAELAKMEARLNRIGINWAAIDELIASNSLDPRHPGHRYAACKAVMEQLKIELPALNDGEKDATRKWWQFWK